jgi:hypothetical protein
LPHGAIEPLPREIFSEGSGQDGEGRMTKEQLGDAIADEKPFPKVCGKHPRPVVYEGPECPCCRIMAENPTLTPKLRKR